MLTPYRNQDIEAQPSRRVLHVLGALGRGGVETWLRELVRRGAGGWRFDFCLLDGGGQGAYEPELTAAGCRILRCPLRPLYSFPYRLATLLRRTGRPVVHSHVHLFSGVILEAARAAGAAVRIAHSHNTHDGRGNGPLRRVYRRTMRTCLSRSMTLGLACSTPAADELAGGRSDLRRRTRVLYYGIRLEDFRTCRPDRAAIRREFGLPADAEVAGHVGRLTPQKNQLFLLDAAAKAMKRRPRLHLAIAGSGCLGPALARKVHELGISLRVHFLGGRADVPRLMCGLFDVFVLPSLHEGLPLAALEAQAAGLPVLLSGSVAQETVVAGELVRRIPLSAGTAAWAAALENSLDSGRCSIETCCRRLAGQGFDVAASLRSLTALYERALASALPAGGSVPHKKAVSAEGALCG